MAKWFAFDACLLLKEGLAKIVDAASGSIFFPVFFLMHMHNSCFSMYR
jgi:hypothetical protein